MYGINYNYYQHTGRLFEKCRVFFPRVKSSEPKADHLPTSSAEVKNEWSCTTTPSTCIYGIERKHLVYDIFNFIVSKPSKIISNKCKYIHFLLMLLCVDYLINSVNQNTFIQSI